MAENRREQNNAVENERNDSGNMLQSATNYVQNAVENAYDAGTDRSKITRFQPNEATQESALPGGPYLRCDAHSISPRTG